MFLMTSMYFCSWLPNTLGTDANMWRAILGVRRLTGGHCEERGNPSKVVAIIVCEVPGDLGCRVSNFPATFLSGSFCTQLIICPFKISLLFWSFPELLELVAEESPEHDRGEERPFSGISAALLTTQEDRHLLFHRQLLV